jgi:hypothetical protein
MRNEIKAHLLATAAKLAMTRAPSPGPSLEQRLSRAAQPEPQLLVAATPRTKHVALRLKRKRSRRGRLIIDRL